MMVGDGRCRGGSHDLHAAVPRAGAERVLGHQVPVHGVHLALVLLPRLHGELVQADVEELDGAVPAGHHELVLVQLGPREVVERILGIEAATAMSAIQATAC